MFKKFIVKYDDDLPKNDFYRLEKALKYAIASKGEFYKARIDEDAINLREIYDIRGFFLMKPRLESIKDIQSKKKFLCIFSTSKYKIILIENYINN